MAEISPVGEPIISAPPIRRRIAGDRGLPPVGAPIGDLPPLVEPAVVGFEDPLAEIRPLPISHRPVRRRFLPPVAQPAAEPSRLPLVRGVRPRAPLRQLAPPPPTDRAARHDDATGAPTRPPPRRLRLALVAVGVAAALAVTTAFEVGVSAERLERLPAAIFYRLLQPFAALKPPADPTRRLAYYTARAETGDAAAQVALAVAYAKGEGVRQDYAAAASWFRRAAEQGVARAQYDLGVLYERGRGVPIDYAQAARWYRKAAQQNHPLAEYNLAVAYTKGEGVERNLYDAAVWYHRAAAQGVVAAMVNLAILYERGDGITASTADAYAWYRAAAQRGSAPAARRADELLRGFSPAQQTQAEAKLADIAAAIDDAVGKGSPPAGTAARSVAAAASKPLLKSGIDGGRATASDAGRTP